jgi:hypothetical protein
MKNFYATLTCTVLFLSVNFKLQAQTTLSVGDIVFTRYISSGPSSNTDAFSFVLLTNISTGTQIKFTDNHWNGTALSTNESTLTFTAGSALAAGREITIVSLHGGTATLFGGSSAGTVTNGGGAGAIALATTGDQILAYQGPDASPSFIAGIHMNVQVGGCGNSTAAGWEPVACVPSLNASVKPAALTTGTNALWIGTEGVTTSEQNNARFICGGYVATVALLRAAANNPANWSLNDDITTYPPSPFDTPPACDYLGIVTLPVSLLSFKGDNTGATIKLNWQTVNESSFKLFELEKSADGTNFTTLSRVDAQGGYSYLPFDYSYTDLFPVEGANIYRLKMINNDGSSKYSALVKVLFGKTGKKVTISPSVTSGDITISYTGRNTFNYYMLTDYSGRTLLQGTMNTNNHRVDVSNLPAGLYIITVTGAGERVSEKITVQH